MGKTIGHVDTWTAWVNGSNSAVTEACDWLGMDAYPYFQTTIDNSIDVANSTFYEALDATEGASMGKPVWVTETGWPVIGETLNQAVAGTENAEIYWSEVACSLIGNRNIWWYILQDAAPTAPATSFGVVGADLSAAPLYDLSCPSNSGMASSATAPASSAEGASSADITNATPGPQTSPSSVSISQSTGSVAASSEGNVPSNQPGTGSRGSTVESSMKASSTAPVATSSAMTQVSSVAPVASSSVMT